VDPRLRAYLLAQEPSDEAFVDGVFGFALRRQPDEEARERALEKLAEGTLSRATLLHELVTSEEFGRMPAGERARAIELRRDAVAALGEQEWVGNLRELEAVLERALLLYRESKTPGGGFIDARAVRAAR